MKFAGKSEFPTISTVCLSRNLISLEEQEMSQLSYQQPGLTVQKGGADATKQQIKDLQRDLRSLGYLKSGIDGKFGNLTRSAVQALQYDLLFNEGKSTGNDGSAPVMVIDYNRNRVVDVTGVVDQDLAGCISDMLEDPDIPLLPKADNPKEENGKIADRILGMSSDEVPIPFLAAILKQESGVKHFSEPGHGDEDTYITVGMDTNSDRKHIITSRGYGLGQYTLFHHPPRKEEVEGFMLDAGKNLVKAMDELKDKFDHFVNGATSGTRADDRIAEYGSGELRRCKYAATDLRYLKDCKQCLKNAGVEEIRMGVTPFYRGCENVFYVTQYYKKRVYYNVPVRRNIGCDWPYAVRRYNGSGVNSYHYQARVLKHLYGLS